VALALITPFARISGTSWHHRPAVNGPEEPRGKARPKVLIGAFHDDGLNQFEAPGCDLRDHRGALEELAEKIADDVIICPRLGLLKPGIGPFFADGCAP